MRRNRIFGMRKRKNIPPTSTGFFLFYLVASCSHLSPLKRFTLVSWWCCYDFLAPSVDCSPPLLTWGFMGSCLYPFIYTECQKKLIAQGRIQDFHLGGGGKRLCAHSRVVIMLSHAIWALFKSILIKKNWIKKCSWSNFFLGGGGGHAPVVRPPPPLWIHHCRICRVMLTKIHGI